MPSRRRAPHFLSALAAALLCGGCASTVPYPTQDEREWLPPSAGAAGIPRLALSVGLHVSAGVADLPLSSKSGLTTVTLTARESIVPYFTWATDQLFDRVQRLGFFRADAPLPEGLAAVIELSGAWPGALQVTLHARGQKPAAWNITGASPGVTTSDAANPAAREVTFLLRDALAQYLLGFTDQPDMKAWLAREGASVTRAQGDAGAPAPAAGERYVMTGSEADGMDCIGNRLSSQLPMGTLVPLERARLRMFPWLEPSVAPPTSEPTAHWMRDELRLRARAEGIRYLLDFSGGSSNSKSTDAVGCGAYGCLGLVTGTRRSSFRAVLRDLWEGRIVFEEAVYREGGYAMPFFLLPIPLIPATEAAACEELAGRIRGLLPAARTP